MESSSLEDLEEILVNESTTTPSMSNELPKESSSEVKKKTRQDFYNISVESSRTKFYKKPTIGAKSFQHVTRKEYLSISESISGSSATHHCVHGPEGKKYTEKGLLKRNILKELDPIPIDRKWNDECAPSYGWDIAKKLEYMVQSSTVALQTDRLQAHLRDFAKTSKNGYRIDTLNSFCIIMNFLLESVNQLPMLKEGMELLLKNLRKPVLLKASSDCVTYFDTMRHYIGFVGYLLIRVEEDYLFDMVSHGILWHLSAPDSIRGPGTFQLRHTLAAAAQELQKTTVRMIAVASKYKFSTFLEIALFLACHSSENCISMMKENIIENIFYRFNPYFPERDLPSYDINPNDCQDDVVKLGDSTVNMSTTLSLLLVLVKTTKQYLMKNPNHRELLPHPDCYAQRIPKNLMQGQYVSSTSRSGGLKELHEFGYRLYNRSYLLIRVEEDYLFDMVSHGILWHLSAPDSIRGPGTFQLRHTLAAAAQELQKTTVRMIAVASKYKFSTFLEIALFLACHSSENCISMMKENIIENIFYRFNPYFPERDLPSYDINPNDCQDDVVKLGDSTVNMSTTLSLLLVLVKTTKQYLMKNPNHRELLPHPDCYAQRCFVWAYRYECRAREHRHERITLTVIAAVLVKCFGDKLLFFSSVLMPDIISLSVLTELPPRRDWLGTVNFNTAQQDVQFKKVLIHFVVELLKTFPYNKFMMESRHWLLGIMYLLDPGLCHLRSHWSPSLFAELRKTGLQALVCAIPFSDQVLVRKYGLMRRIMWYIEWYSESPYEIQVLYWCMRLLQVAIYHKRDPIRHIAMKSLFDTHGIIILIHLCYTIMNQKLPPTEKSQAVIALSLRMLTSAVNTHEHLSCCVYPNIKWPTSINSFARKMLNMVLFSLEKHLIVSDRWLISLLNFIWEAIIWNQQYREQFVANDGVYKLLDIITMTRPPVQCIALALICDVVRAGNAVGHLVSWRANLAASSANPNVVKRGATIANLLAAVFREGCLSSGVNLNEYGVLQDMEFAIMSVDAQNELQQTNINYMVSHSSSRCLAAADLAGSCMSKAFAILHMLSEDLEYKVELADETYNLYKHIKLVLEDEVILVLCSHYLTLKQNEVWKEAKAASIGIYEKDNMLLEEFLNVDKSWTKEIKRQQEEVISKERNKEHEDESSLYAFLGRIRLNIALDALRAVRCVARSSDRDRVTHAQLHDAVFAHQRREVFAKKNNAALLRTYKPPLDDQNITGQNVKVTSIHTQNLPKTADDNSSFACQKRSTRF